MAASLDRLARSKNSPLRFQPVDQAERQRLVQQAQEVQRFRQQRQGLENNPAGRLAGTRTKEFEPARVRLPASPIVARPGAALAKDHVPPRINEAPKPDYRVAAKPRVNRSAPQPQQQPKAERQAPQQQPKAEQQTPQPRAERQAPQPRGNAPAGAPAAGSKQGNPKGKDQK